ncbi:hypothetical protein [Sinorhizobium sp. A49]|uniref:hypothetical protein n=1 Tax=Sinorhizobium sp. A49 TaxID=1945861 RepID=UPI000985D7AC|nr:hypothetical protein [Sinorhizobium sp. A49]OOG70813.1 hypothetical protein B0E45_12370 [Sinorhizobium sp. A49]
MANELICAANGPTDDADPVDIVANIRRLIVGATLDCACRAEIERLLLQFERLTAGRDRQRRLDRARYQRRRIAAIAELLCELDEVDSAEADGSLLAEAQLLFQDIAEAARTGAVILAGAIHVRPKTGADHDL